METNNQANNQPSRPLHMMPSGKKCYCGRENFRMVIPMLMILGGVTFSLGAQGYLDAYTVDNVWPILFGFAGLIKLAQAWCPCDPGCGCGCK